LNAADDAHIGGMAASFASLTGSDPARRPHKHMPEIATATPPHLYRRLLPDDELLGKTIRRLIAVGQEMMVA
jgi:hypothetical protein